MSDRSAHTAAPSTNATLAAYREQRERDAHGRRVEESRSKLWDDHVARPVGNLSRDWADGWVRLGAALKTPKAPKAPAALRDLAVLLAKLQAVWADAAAALARWYAEEAQTYNLAWPRHGTFPASWSDRKLAPGSAWLWYWASAPHGPKDVPALMCDPPSWPHPRPLADALGLLAVLADEYDAKEVRWVLDQTPDRAALADAAPALGWAILPDPEVEDSLVAGGLTDDLIDRCRIGLNARGAGAMAPDLKRRLHAPDPVETSAPEAADPEEESRKEEAAITVLRVVGPNMTRIAKALGVPRTTPYRWVKQFMPLYDEKKAEEQRAKRERRGRRSGSDFTSEAG